MFIESSLSNSSSTRNIPVNFGFLFQQKNAIDSEVLNVTLPPTDLIDYTTINDTLTFLETISEVSGLTEEKQQALILDLKQRGMLDDTLVIWGGEFGRTNFCQGKFDPKTFGRDHHPRCFTIWMAGAGIKKGITIGQTDDFGYNIVSDPVHVHDFQATLMHLMGIDHERFTHKFQGRRFRLTDVHGKVIKDLLA